MTFHPKPFQIAGFELFGKLLPNGQIEIGFGDTDIMENFPDEVEVCGATYALEAIKENKIDGRARRLMTPEAIANAERIRWGVYV